MTTARYPSLAGTARVLALVLAGQGVAQAESRCWPEHALIGQPAQAYVWGSASAAAAPLRSFSARGTPHALLSCNAFLFLRATPSTVPATCDDEAAFLPIAWSATVPGLARAALRSGGATWFKPTQLGEVHAILAPGRSGTVFPAGAAVRVAPDLAAGLTSATAAIEATLTDFINATSPSPVPTLAQALATRGGPYYLLRTAQRQVRNQQGTWMQVGQHLAYSEDGGLTFQDGPALPSGYLLHRDSAGRVRTVLEAVWCD